MKRHIVFGAVVSAALAASPVLAQSPGTQPGSSTARPSPSSTDDRNQSSRNRSVTVSGCLQDAAKSTTGSSASSGSGSQMSRGAAAGDVKFILINASAAAGSGAAPSASGTAGTSGATTPHSQSGYQLIGGGSEDLSKFVNERVEVRGTLVPDVSTDRSGRSSEASTGSTSGSAGSSTSSPSGSGSPSGSTTGSGSMSGTGAGSPATADLPKLRVTSVRSIGGSCSDVQR